MPNPKSRLMPDPILVCDLGGTNCRFGLIYRGALDPASIRSVKNADAPDFIAQIQRYLRELGPGHWGTIGASLGAIVVALAAPIEGDRVTLTNLDWTVDRAELQQSFSVDSVLLLNDFLAIGYALAAPEGLNTRPLSSGQAAATGNRLTLGAGTGFNCSAYLSDGVATMNEAGHASFVPITEFDLKMRDLMGEKYGRCSNERLLSGRGFVEIHAAISGRPTDEISGHRVMQAGVAGQDRDARQSCLEFARMLGQTAGDLALLFWARGGVWLSGGPCRALGPILAAPEGPFHTAFRQKGRMSNEMAQMPVALIEDDYAALWGCGEYYRKHTDKIAG